MTDITHRHSDTDQAADQAGTGRFVVHRPPRSYPSPVPTAEVVIAPPPPRRGGTGGWLAALLPLLGSAGSLLLLGTTAPRRRWLILAIVVSPLLALGAGLVPLLRQRRAARRERARYLHHLGSIARALERVAAIQRAAAEHLYPDLPGIMKLAGEDERLWERRTVDEDFLAVRIGRGPVPLAAPVRLDSGPDPLAERDPQLLAAADELVRHAGWLQASPVVAPLRRTAVLAVTGPRAPARALVRFLLAQLTVMHAPEDLRIIAACAAADVPIWDWPSPPHGPPPLRPCLHCARSGRQGRPPAGDPRRVLAARSVGAASAPGRAPPPGGGARRDGSLPGRPAYRRAR